MSVAPAATGAGPVAPMLSLDGFEGPLDLLLELARAQKVDLSRISILALVEQYLAVVRRAEVALEVAADWLVMAAWLAWLKSRALLPDDPAATGEAEAAAGALGERLLALARIAEAARRLDAGPQLGRDVFARGAAESLCRVDRSGLVLHLGQLLGAYMTACRRTTRRGVYRPRPVPFWTMGDALDRLRRLLGEAARDWCALHRFLPEITAASSSADADRGRRAALAGTLLAGLEMARDGAIELRQDAAFGPVLLRLAPAGPA